MKKTLFLLLFALLVGASSKVQAEDNGCPGCNPDSCSCLHDDQMGDFCLCLLAPDNTGVFQGTVKQNSTGLSVPATFTFTKSQLTVEFITKFSGIKTTARAISPVQTMQFSKKYAQKAGFESITFKSGSFNNKTGQFGGFELNISTTPLKKIKGAKTTG